MQATINIGKLSEANKKSNDPHFDNLYDEAMTELSHLNRIEQRIQHSRNSSISKLMKDDDV